MTELLINEQIYQEFIKKEVPRARTFLWIATADLKDMFLEHGGKFVPFLSLIRELVVKGVEVRLLHAKEPGIRFREEFDRFPELITTERFERALCPRVHFKTIIVDGQMAYMGSANVTGAGMGARNPEKRNFETGIKTRDAEMIDGLMELYDTVFLGSRCSSCKLRDVCPDPIA